MVPVGLPVVVRKVGRQAPEILDAQFAGRGVDDELEGLPDVLHRRAALDDDVAGFVTFDHEIFDRLMFQLLENLVEPGDIALLQLADGLQHSARMLVLDVGH